MLESLKLIPDNSVTMKIDFEEYKRSVFFLRLLVEGCLLNRFSKEYPLDTIHIFNVGQYQGLEMTCLRLSEVRYFLGTYTKDSDLLIASRVNEELLKSAIEAASLSTIVLETELRQRMGEYQSFCDEAENIGRLYSEKLSALRKDSLKIDALYTSSIENANKTYMDALRALNRAPQIDRLREAIKILQYFYLKCVKTDMKFHLSSLRSEDDAYYTPSSSNSSLLSLNYCAEKVLAKPKKVDSPSIPALSELITSKKKSITYLIALKSKLSSLS